MCNCAGAHTDWGMLTVLATDAQPGLQISHEDAWIDVEPRPGHFVINIGDLLDRYAPYDLMTYIAFIAKFLIPAALKNQGNVSCSAKRPWSP